MRVAGVATTGLLVLGFYGCAASTIGPEGTGGSSSKSSSSSSGTGAGGAGGMAGTGGEGAGTTSLCEQDCSLVQPPDCYQSVCNEGMYPGPVGSCVIVPVDDGAACDDGQFCTVSDTCQAGVCTGGPPNDCGMQPPPCTEVTCNESTQSCSTAPANNGDPCQTSDLCIKGSTCLNGLCTGGTPDDCFFQPVPDDCHVSQCNPMNGMCEPVVGNEGGPCTDGTDLCTVNKTCTAGVCGGGMPKDCSNLTQGCVLGVCDTNTGQCTTQAVGQGMACDDLDACTIGEICNNGMCNGGTPITNCVDNDQCCPSGCDELNDSDCAKEEYSQNFPTGTIPITSQQCIDWGTFIGQLTGSFTAVTIRGSNDMVGATCNVPSLATQLCNALNTSTIVSNISCNGRIWNVGDCSVSTGQPFEINARAASGDCSCDSSAYTVRPCIGNNNWGGINGPACSAATQTMEVICFR
ncbi:MAG: hypothetical protein R3B72_34360 [Polyangiaceae bacterium]